MRVWKTNPAGELEAWLQDHFPFVAKVLFAVFVALAILSRVSGG